MESLPNGQVTLAVLGERINHLSQQLKEHDELQRECRRTCQTDHDTITRHESELTMLAGDVIKAKAVVDGLRNESRVFASVASLVAVVAGVLGLSK